MPVFNVASAFGRQSGGQDYGFLVDQLDIKKSQLEEDGKLSPGDYDLLKKEAQKIYAHPGLSKAQRSNIEVKMAGFDRDKKVNTNKDAGDIQRMNREVTDDYTKITMRYASDPRTFLTKRAEVLNAKIDSLSETIDRMEFAQDDATNHVNELTNTLSEYSDTLQALDDVEQYDGSGVTKSNFATYLITNAQGEVVDMKIDRVGGKSGYIETNGLYAGLPVYGKVNRKEQNKNVFVLGNKAFSAVDYLQPGPDGTFAPSKLVDTSLKQGSSSFSRAPSVNVDIDPTTIRSQSAIPAGGWVEKAGGGDGFLYQRQKDGSYKKHLGADRVKLGVSDNEVMVMPKSFVESIQPYVMETIPDSTFSSPTPAPAFPTGPGVNYTPFTPGSATPSATQTPKGRPAATAPTERVGTSFGSVASRAIKSATGYLQGLFAQ